MAVVKLSVLNWELGFVLGFDLSLRGCFSGLLWRCFGERERERKREEKLET